VTAGVFLAGIVLPASLRYADLFRAIGTDDDLLAHELVIYRSRPDVPGGYSIQQEVEALDRAMSAAGHDAFHLYGHSAGGAIALAYTAAHPDRVLSLALDEPSTDFSEEDLRSDYWTNIQALRKLPLAEQIPAFRVLQVDPSFAPPPVHQPRPSWMAGGETRIAAFSDAVLRHHLPRTVPFPRPVLFSYGSLTNPRFDWLRASLARRFLRFEAERYEGLHHLHSGHQAEPQRVAVALRRLWEQAVPSNQSRSRS
jgi:pimeloyl-ACP methyl ester carboxylesterase